MFPLSTAAGHLRDSPSYAAQGPLAALGLRLTEGQTMPIPQLPVRVGLAAVAAVFAAGPAAAAARVTSAAPIKPTPGQATELVGYSAVPAGTFGVRVPSGRYLGSTPINGVTPPFPAQPIQGFSAVLPQANGTVLTMSDNGYGTKANSADFLLRVNRIRPHYGSHRSTVVGGFNLSDPHHRVPFPITRHDRRLTGADFDIESFRRVADGTLWFGDEFGPFLLHTDARGRVLSRPIPLSGIYSPDDPELPPGHPATINSSRGFEGMALSPNGRLLYPLLEAPVIGDDPQTLRMYTFDTTAKRYVDPAHYLRYRLESPTDLVGDLTALDVNRFLAVEHDPNGGAAARLKAVYLLDRRDRDTDGYLDKTLLVNLLALPDPGGVAPGAAPFYSFSVTSLEAVAVLGRHTILVGNDNNYPFNSDLAESASRPDDNVFLRIRVSTDLHPDPRVLP